MFSTKQQQVTSHYMCAVGSAAIKAPQAYQHALLQSQLIAARMPLAGGVSSHGEADVEAVAPVRADAAVLRLLHPARRAGRSKLIL